MDDDLQQGDVVSIDDQGNAQKEPGFLDALKGQAASLMGQGPQAPLPPKPQYQNVGLNQPQGDIQQASYQQPMPVMQNPYANLPPPPQIQNYAQSQAGQAEMAGAQKAAADVAIQGQLYGQAQQTAAARSSEELRQQQAYGDSAMQLAQTTHEKYQAAAQERDNLLKDANNGAINPNHFHENMSTGQKIMTALGMLIGGAGAGILHQENPVVKWLSQQTERDIEAQKSNINSIYQHYNNSIADANDSTSFMRAVLLQKNANALAGIAQKYTDPQAKANAALYAQQLQTQSDWNLSQVAGSQGAKQFQIDQQNAQNQYAYNTNKAVMGAQFQQANYANQVLQDPGVDPMYKLRVLSATNRVTPQESEKIATEIGKARNMQQNEGAIMAAFNRADQQNGLMKVAGRFGREAPANTEMDSLLLPQLKDEAGKVSDTELHTVQGFHPFVTDSKDVVEQKRAGLQQFLRGRQETPLAESKGIYIPKPQAPAGTGFNQRQTIKR